MRLPPPITSRSNARVKALRAAFAGRASAPGEVTAVEGEHLLSEIALAGLELEAVYVREGDERLLGRPLLRKLRAREHILLSRDVFDSAVDTATPQGIAGTLSIPTVQVAEGQADGVVLLLEAIQDPGNVGTLIRSAAAFGASLVVLVGECANPWSPKVLRASAGAVFHVPVLRQELEAARRKFKGHRRLIAAVPNRSGAVLATKAELTKPVLMIGNEGRGLSPQALALADQLVTIPCQIESFNAAVAGSLLLYEAYRQNAAQGAQTAEGAAR